MCLFSVTEAVRSGLISWCSKHFGRPRSSPSCLCASKFPKRRPSPAATHAPEGTPGSHTLLSPQTWPHPCSLCPWGSPCFLHRTSKLVVGPQAVPGGLGTGRPEFKSQFLQTLQPQRGRRTLTPTPSCFYFQPGQGKFPPQQCVLTCTPACVCIPLCACMCVSLCACMCMVHSMHACTHGCVRVCAYTCMCACLCMHVCMHVCPCCIYACICVYVCTHMGVCCVCLRVQIYTRVCMCAHISVYACLFVCACVCAYAFRCPFPSSACAAVFLHMFGIFWC